MGTSLVKGQNGPVAAARVTVSVRTEAAVDLSALLVTESGTVRSDADFVFFNQPVAPGVELTSGAPAALAISPAALPGEIAQVRAVLTLDDPADTFGRFTPPVATVADDAGNVLYEYMIEGLGTESVVIALELYRRGAQWKVRAVGQGYAGGFAALVTDHGVVVDDEPEPSPSADPATTRPRPAPTTTPPLASAGSTARPAASRPAPTPPMASADSTATPSSHAIPTARPTGAVPSATVLASEAVSMSAAAEQSGPNRSQAPDVRTVPGEAKLSFEKRAVLDLRKREVAKVLIDREALGVRARVVLVIDKTGSMVKQYRKKVVHRVVERMIPIATQLDDDGTLEAYLYALSYTKLPDIEVAEGDRWSETFLHLNGTHAGIDYSGLGGRNDELPIMRAVIETLRPGGPPTLVLFFTDGGFAKKPEIAALMREASRLPAFWQFVGLGQANYGLLRTIDEMDGRLVDNAGFFALDDIDAVDDAQLYTRLLGEFPQWLRAARAAGVTN
ncbi:vWA domain-containing protein [Nocardia lijiangensis]|uniref:vWA domain-containing protein n=1 Tax=Nocardia lijiangensis TaxID=299618 RepID=UPI000AD3C608|nr:VWA domain-containing protein [Nocardia lijiangensis]